MPVRIYQLTILINSDYNLNFILLFYNIYYYICIISYIYI